MNRIVQHPFLEVPQRRTLIFYYNKQAVPALEGDTIAAALIANGIRVLRETSKRKEPRGMFCGIGQCGDCMMVVNGRPNVRTCVTLVEDGMQVETQIGLGGDSHETL